MQKEGKEKGKKSKMVPLITVTEGVEEESKGRNRTKEAVHFVDEKFSTKELWKSVEGYIGASYELDIVENIYVHGDGGQWIKNGLENFSNVKRLMDGFHLEKRLKEAAGRFPNRNLRRRNQRSDRRG